MIEDWHDGPQLQIASEKPSREHFVFLAQSLPDDPFLKLLIIGIDIVDTRLVCLSIRLNNELVGTILFGPGWNTFSVIFAAATKEPLATAAILLSPSGLRSGFGLLGKPRGFSIPNELLYLALSSSMRGHHVARTLMEKAIEESQLIPGTWVRTLSTNPAAIKAYLGVGFSIKAQKFGRTYLQFGRAQIG